MTRSNCAYSTKQVQLMNRLRKLWSQHVMWTRSFIISTAAEAGDLEAVTRRLLRNPIDFEDLLRPFYGAGTADQFQQLFTQHLLIAADLVDAAKNNDEAAVQTARTAWYKNADDIAAFLGSINANWIAGKWRNMLYRHLDMTEQEATLRLQGRFADDVRLYDAIEEEALHMADYMSRGLIRQFSVR